MAFQSVPNVFEADLNMTYRSVPIQMTFYFEVPTASYTLLSAELIATRLSAYAVATLFDWMPVEVAMANVTARGLANQNDIIYINADDAGSTGARTNDYPNNVAWAVKRTSGLTGRSARGRVYWPVASADRDASSENQLAVASANAIVATLNGVENAVDAGTEPFSEVIVSRWNNGVLRATGITFDVASYSYTDLRIDTMRTRLP